MRDTHSKSAEMVPINPVPGPGSASAPYLTASKWAHHCEFSGSGAGAGTIENISSGVPPRYFCILHIVSAECATDNTGWLSSLKFGGCMFR